MSDTATKKPAGAKAGQNKDKDAAAKSDAETGDAKAKAGGKAKKAGGSKKLIMMASTGLVLLLVAGGGVWFFTAGSSDAASEPVVVEKGPPVYSDLPEMVVDLKSQGGRPRYIKLTVTIEVAGEEARLKLDAVKPRVISGFQTFLRDQSAADLAGKAGTDLIHEAFLKVANDAVGPDLHVNDILFRSILVQ